MIILFIISAIRAGTITPHESLYIVNSISNVSEISNYEFNFYLENSLK